MLIPITFPHARPSESTSLGTQNATKAI
jgi:hypothetical protein